MLDDFRKIYFNNEIKVCNQKIKPWKPGNCGAG